MNAKYKIDGKEVTNIEFNQRIADLDFKSAWHKRTDSGETYSFLCGEVVELVVSEETNEHGFSRELRTWQLFTFLYSKRKEVELGKLGEHIARLYIYNGRLSASVYDSSKDIQNTLGDHIEIKTQVRFQKYNAFTIRENQLDKCKQAAFLIFVEYSKSSNKISVWHCVNNKEPFLANLNNGSTRYAYAIDEMKLIDTLEAPTLARKMRALSTSYTCK